MKNISIIYWSGTGNTQKMAISIAEGAKKDDCSIKIVEVANATIEDVLSADAVALGCPSMGCEVLEEDEMEPFIESLETESLKDKPVALFGSYDWGDGEWMREWQKRMIKLGINLVDDGLIVQNTPDDDGINSCKQLGVKLASVI